MGARDTFVRSLDEDLKHQMRVVALHQGITLGKALNQAMALWLAREVMEGRAKVEVMGPNDDN